MQTKLIIEQHLHGAFGVDFNKSSIEEIIDVSRELLPLGIGGFFPTLVTDKIENLKNQIEIIKQASMIQDGKGAKVLGIHLEANFINPEKKGIHNPKHFLELTKENFQQIEDDFIKIVTLAPELDIDLIDYLKNKGVKIQAGHCIGGDLDKCDGVTHLFNAMAPVIHRGKSCALTGLVNDNLYTEIIADGLHLSDDILRLIFKCKPSDKIILISDALPVVKSDLKETVFADEVIYFDGIRATSKDGTLAGSTMLIPDIIKLLGNKNMFNPQFINNVYDYHGISLEGQLEWDEDYNVVSVTKPFWQ